MSEETTELQVAKPVSDFDMVQRQARALAASQWLPAHLKSQDDTKTIATCMSIVNMSKRWGFDTSNVAASTYVVRDKLGFEGKLYAALANSRGNLHDKLQTIFHGAGDALAAVVFGSTGPLTDKDRENLMKYLETGDSRAVTELLLNGVKCVRLTVAQCKTDQAMWKKSPEQKLFYTGATQWCRRFLPELVFGALSLEDLEYEAYAAPKTVAKVLPKSNAVAKLIEQFDGKVVE